MSNNRKKGFTLIELLVVIAIIGMLAATVLVSLGTARAKGRDAKRIADLKNIELAIQLFSDSNKGAVPATISALTPTYLAKEPKDPNTDASYAYTPCNPVAGNASKFMKYQLGADLENLAPVHEGDSDTGATGGNPALVSCTSAFTGEDESSCMGSDTNLHCYDLTN
ncbi:MAG TPA: type II secretion system protein [Candidatus Paceibacterota bacterium]|nr:type II secretion system protein [Candidatus Paceibacterota bacterium]